MTLDLIKIGLYIFFLHKFFLNMVLFWFVYRVIYCLPYHNTLLQLWYKHSFKLHYLIIFIIILILSFFFFYNFNLFFKTNNLPNSKFKFYKFFKSFNSLNIVFILITILISIVCFIIHSKKYKKYSNKYLNLYWYFVIIVFFLTSSKSLFSFFVFYEMFLFPSVFLVFFSSPNSRSYKTSIYFLLWTQLGSFLILISCAFLIYHYHIIYFSDFFFKHVFKHTTIIHILIFFGFGIKIPVWPFHFWLTKTHVEANTGFSIFLSGILVKIAVFGLYKFLPLFSYTSKFLFIFIPIMSFVDCALKIAIQTDLKKIVAYATIFEMNYIILSFAFYSFNSINIIILLIIFHSCISGLYFYIVDIIYKNYNTRIINSIFDISKYGYLLPIFIVISTLFFLGFPLTIKFTIELYIINKLFSYNFIIFFIFLVSTLIFNFFYTKAFFSLLHGSNLKPIKAGTLKKTEILIFLTFLFILCMLAIV